MPNQCVPSLARSLRGGGLGRGQAEEGVKLRQVQQASKFQCRCPKRIRNRTCRRCDSERPPQVCPRGQLGNRSSRRRTSGRVGSMPKQVSHKAREAFRMAEIVQPTAHTVTRIAETHVRAFMD